MQEIKNLKMILTVSKRNEAIDKISRAYFKLLTSIDWNDSILIYGLREGLDKFLSNAFIKEYGVRKYMSGDYYSAKALKRVKRKNYTNLVYEHMIPKKVYIQIDCEKQARNGELTVEYIKAKLHSFWHIAIVLKEEEKLLNRTKMPDNWDEKDILSRYSEKGIELLRIISD